MNSFQRWLSRVSGADELIEQQNEQNTNLVAAVESVQSEYSKLERILEDVNYVNLFAAPDAKEGDVIPHAKRISTIKLLRRLRHENPIAKQAVRLAVRFTFGRGISYSIEARRPRKIIDTFWNDPDNLMTLTSHEAMQARFDETMTDGEKFFIFFVDPSPPWVRMSEIPMEEIVDIIYDPENRRIPVYYKRSFVRYKYDATANNNQGQYVPENGGQPIIRYYRDFRISDEKIDEITLNIPESLIEEGFIKHRMINAVRMKNGTRGISELFSSRDWFRVFKDFMEDRGAINAAANAFSYIRETKGGPAAVAKMVGKIGGVPIDQSDETMVPGLRKLTKPIAAAIYDVNENVNLKTVRADTGAINAKEDARLLLMAAGAGVATNIHYFGEGGDANLATAQAMELPMVKGYEDWQKFTQEEFTEICQFVYRKAIGDDGAPPFEIAFDYPPIITQDVVKWTTAYGQLVQQIGSQGNIKLKEIGIRGALYTLDVPNVDTVMKDIMDEEERIAEEKAADKEMQQNLQLQGGLNPPPGGNKPPKNGADNGRPEGQKAGNGGGVDPLGPDLKRIANGKRPRFPATGPRTRKN